MVQRMTEQIPISSCVQFHLNNEAVNFEDKRSKAKPPSWKLAQSSQTLHSKSGLKSCTEEAVEFKPSLLRLATTRYAKKQKAGRRTGTFSSCRFHYLSQHSDSPMPALMVSKRTPHPAAPIWTRPGNGQLLLPPEGQEFSHCSSDCSNLALPLIKPGFITEYCQKSMKSIPTLNSIHRLTKAFRNLLLLC